ncbi:MAG: cytochrome c biogenesis protein CcdA, partial [Candidatus Hodarchaeota archaeon]
VMGAIVIFLGVVTLSQTLREKLRLTSLSIGRQPDEPTGLLGVFLVGFGYSLLAAPCSGPVIISLPFIFGTQNNILWLIVMFLLLSIGVMAPYLAIALVTGEARNRLATRIVSSARKLEIVIGCLLIIVGFLLMLPWLEFVLSL